MPTSPTDFHLTFTGPDFMWMGERRPDLPFLRWPDGRLCEPIITYFGYSAEVKRVRPSSMKPEAYAIREWLAFLANQGKRWDEPSDLLFSMWRESHRPLVDSGEMEARQVQRKLGFVFDFYRLLPDAMPLDERCEPRHPFVGKHNARDGVFYPITSKIAIDPGEAERETWSGAERVGKSVTKRSTPDETDVDKILTWLRAKGERTTSRRTAPGAQNWTGMEAERNWMIGRCMVDGGLRADEATGLTLHTVAKALRNASIALPQEIRTHGQEAIHILDRMSDMPEAQVAVLTGLNSLEAKGRRNIYVEVIGKGRKQRNAPFSIDLVRDLLQIGIWTVRRAQAAAWAADDRKFQVPPQVLLSFKTKAAMTAGAVGDIMKGAFKSLDIEGSGHRLRAHYATMTAARLWDECFAMNGYRFDQTVVNMALDRLAEALGHSKVTTTVRFYLDMALLKHFGVENRAKLDAVRVIWDAVVQRQGSLSESKMRLILKVVDGLAATPDGAELEQVITMAVEDGTLNPSANQPTPSVLVENKERPNLRLVK